MDRRIIFCMVIFNMAAISFFYIYKSYSKSNSISLRYKFDYKGSIYNLPESLPDSIPMNPGDSIVYSGLSPEATAWNWDFGDGEISLQPSGAHTYISGGVYIVKVKINSASGIAIDSSVKIKVGSVAPPVMKAPQILIKGNDSAITGKPTIYECAIHAASCEWSLAQQGIINKQNSTVYSYSFKTPGTYKLTLTTHNPDESDQKIINVIAGVPEVKKHTATPKRHVPHPPHPHSATVKYVYPTY